MGARRLLIMALPCQWSSLHSVSIMTSVLPHRSLLKRFCSRSVAGSPMCPMCPPGKPFQKGMLLIHITYLHCIKSMGRVFIQLCVVCKTNSCRVLMLIKLSSSNIARNPQLRKENGYMECLITKSMQVDKAME